MVQNTGLSKNNVKQTIDTSTKAVTNTVESNALISSAMGIKKESMILVPPLIALIKFINNGLMSGDESKSLVGKVASIGDKISDFFKLGKFEGNGEKAAQFVKKNRFTKYFTSDYKAVPKNSLAKTVKMSEKYATALVDTLKKVGVDVSSIEEVLKEGFESSSTIVDDIIQKADDFLATNPTKRKREISGLRNMLKAADSKVGKTSLGKALSKGFLKAKEIMFSTSDFLGTSKMNFISDFVSIVFFAGVLHKAYQESKDAPKDEKLSTFMHVLSEDYAPLMVMQPATSMVYKLGGNKYRGMTVANRKALQKHIATTNATEKLTKEAYKLAKYQKKLLLKGVDAADVSSLAGKTLKEAKQAAKSFTKKLDLKLWERPLKFVGKILDTALDNINSPTLLGKLKNKMKGFGGGLGRLILAMFIIQPLLQKPITKLVHKIFGKPTAYLKKQEEQEKADEAKNNTDVSVNAPQSNNGSTNLLDKWSTSQPVQQQAVYQPVNQTPYVAHQTIQNQHNVSPMVHNIQPKSTNDEIAALNLFNKNKQAAPYIPSIVVEEDKNTEKELEAKVDLILKSTDFALKSAQESLAD